MDMIFIQLASSLLNLPTATAELPGQRPRAKHRHRQLGTVRLSPESNLPGRVEPGRTSAAFPRGRTAHPLHAHHSRSPGLPGQLRRIFLLAHQRRQLLQPGDELHRIAPVALQDGRRPKDHLRRRRPEKDRDRDLAAQTHPDRQPRGRIVGTHRVHPRRMSPRGLPEEWPGIYRQFLQMRRQYRTKTLPHLGTDRHGKTQLSTSLSASERSPCSNLPA